MKSSEPQFLLDCWFVAPVRERGLKYAYNESPIDASGRSREGAWIEIVAVDKSKVGDCGRSREGAWIEISSSRKVLPRLRSRSREGAWIEMFVISPVRDTVGTVAPVRERGLKLLEHMTRLLYSSRSREGAWIEISVRAEFGNDPRSRSREGAWIEM